VDEQSRGLGDDIAKITHALGLDKITERITDALGIEDCGCDKRQALLNELYPHKKDEEKKSAE